MQLEYLLGTDEQVRIDSLLQTSFSVPIAFTMSPLSPQSWSHRIDSQSYEVSTVKTFLNHGFMHKGFADPQMYWTNDVPEPDLITLIEQSCCFGVYLVNDDGRREQVGMARLLTDYVTAAYLTVCFIFQVYSVLRF